MVRVLGLVPYALGRVPGQRFRIEQWAPLFPDEGVEMRFSPFLSERGTDILYKPGLVGAKTAETVKGFARRLAEVLRSGSYDVAYVYREVAFLEPAWFETLLARRVPFVFDFDDAIYLPAASGANRWTTHVKSGRKTATICRLARHVTVGNHILEAYARQHSPAVTVIPTTIDLDFYSPRDRPPNSRPIVGWTGSGTTAPYLAALAPALRALRQKTDFELRVIGAVVAIPGVDVVCRPWKAETEADDLRALDVGLMPLPDDEWSRGKCAAKALQYMALEIPPVVSPVGVNSQVVRDGVNGFLAASDDEWVDRILRLVRDPRLRQDLGKEARRTVETGFSARVQAPRMAEVLRRAARA